MLSIANTLNLVDFSLSLTVFQSNDVSGSQSYSLEYRTGATGDFTTLGSNFTTSSIAISDFLVTNYSISGVPLASIANQADAVYFRVRGVSGSSGGTGNLDTIGIDNFSLTYTAIPEPSTYGLILGAGALGFAAYRRRRRAGVAG